MSLDTDNVIAFPGVRVATEPATLIVGATLTEEPVSVQRQFGVNDQLTLAEFGRDLRILFGWRGEDAPTKFTIADDVVLPMSALVGDILQDPGDRVTWYWGLWPHVLEVREAFARDEATPDALCIGGSGNVTALFQAGADPTVDIAAINEELTGEESIQKTLASARREVVDLIERSGVFEFVPLLQALDLRRECSLEDPELLDAAAHMSALPAESPDDDPAGFDAALTTLLCLSALTTEDVRHDVSAHVMDAIGWVRDDGKPLTGEDVDELCPDTLAVLEEYGLCGEESLGPVAKLDLLREALRAREGM
ncbi:MULTISPECIES: hypothetical protein [unclassified Corynebacterium]|uniref:hypothetical protein n=1 Tax=unclassified Corynebacterium TaxID=2624378 RepID=UPI0030A15C38